jgi:hypothetical protein
MSAKYKFTGGRGLSSKEEVKDAVRSILYHYGDGRNDEMERGYQPDPVLVPEKPALWLREMFEHFRPRAIREKTGGLDYGFEITKLPTYPSYHKKGPWAGMAKRTLRLVLSSGERVTISFTHLSDKANWQHDLELTLRYIVSPKIERYRQAVLSEGTKLYCPRTREPLAPGCFHIDHYSPSFKTLVERFMESEKITAGSHLFDGRIPGTVWRCLKDQDLAERWKIYHDAECTLMPLSAEANIKRGRADKTQAA